MAKKNIPQKLPREMTRRRLATWQKQRRRQRFILYGGIGLIAIAVLTVLIGWIVADAVPRGKTALAVNDVEYTASDCVNAVIAYGPPAPGEVAQAAVQIVPLLQQKEIIAQEAVALGIEVTDEDIKSVTDQNGLGKKFRGFVELDLIQQAVMTHFTDQIPTVAPQRQVHAMLLVDQDQAEMVRQQLLDGQDFATLTELTSVNAYTKDSGGDLGWHQRGFFEAENQLGSAVPVDWAWQAAEGELSPVLADPDVMKPGGYWIWMVTERSEEQGSHVYGMQFGALAAAESAYQRLQAGDDFSTLAAEVSQYLQSPEGSPGEIGWFLDDGLVASMQNFVPDAPLNTPSQPIRDASIYTDGGFWLVRVAGVDAARAVSLEEIQALGNAAYGEWQAGVLADTRHQIQNNWDLVSDWVIKQVMAEVS